MRTGRQPDHMGPVKCESPVLEKFKGGETGPGQLGGGGGQRVNFFNRINHKIPIHQFGLILEREGKQGLAKNEKV